MRHIPSILTRVALILSISAAQLRGAATPSLPITSPVNTTAQLRRVAASRVFALLVCSSLDVSRVVVLRTPPPVAHQAPVLCYPPPPLAWQCNSTHSGRPLRLSHHSSSSRLVHATFSRSHGGVFASDVSAAKRSTGSPRPPATLCLRRVPTSRSSPWCRHTNRGVWQATHVPSVVSIFSTSVGSKYVLAHTDTPNTSIADSDRAASAQNRLPLTDRGTASRRRAVRASYGS